MRLYQRDLRSEPLPFTPHLPRSMKSIVICFYIVLGIGVSALGAFSFQLWKSNQQVNNVQDEILKANQQQMLLDSVIDRISNRKELVSEIQAWLHHRHDLESVYHDCVQRVPRNLLLERFTVRHVADKSILDFSISVGGDSSIYNTYFRALTSYISEAPNLKIADIQIDVQPQGAVLSLEVLTDKTNPAAIKRANAAVYTQTSETS